jgi:formamidopyrimidine-DNA glycosylase
MPELPEVETIVRGLKTFVPGKTVRRLEVRHAKVAARHGTQAFQNLLTGQTFTGVERRGKFLHFRFSSGFSLVVHLRMTGKFIVHTHGPVPDHPHIRLVFLFTDRTALIYSDLRIFGSFGVYRPEERIPEFECLGRDPVTEKIPAEWFLSQCRQRSIPVKVLLLDQKVLCGIGNIYACEALFRARIDPRLPARKITLKQAALLLREIRAILKLAIRHNGTSVSDFRNVDDKTGGFQKLLKVYGREGQACPRCRRTTIRRIKQAQRSTYFCPKCQGTRPSLDR